jgi:hypothetical protein
MHVQSGLQQFKIFADGNADTHGVDVLDGLQMKWDGERVPAR